MAGCGVHFSYPSDGIDQDCDATESCYVDADLDGARAEAWVASLDLSCSTPGLSLASADLDCDDTNPSAHPAATEQIGTGVDEDCDGAEVCFVDLDADGHRLDDTSVLVSADADCDDLGEAPSTAPIGDCDDSSARHHPGAEEDDCTDPTDYNCDGSVAFADEDGDGFAACAECDDRTDTIHPGAAERCDGLDNDCDGETDTNAVDAATWYADADADGYTSLATQTACAAPAGYRAATPEVDCDDADPASAPGATDLCGDGIDQDCDGADLACDDSGKADGVGCATHPGVAPTGALALVLVALAQRRRLGAKKPASA